jgi:hypothetical protein
MNTHIQWRVGWERGPAMNNERAQPEGITEMQRCKLFVPPWLMTCSHSRLYPFKQLVCECVCVECYQKSTTNYSSKQISVKTFFYIYSPKVVMELILANFSIVSLICVKRCQLMMKMQPMEVKLRKIIQSLVLRILKLDKLGKLS